MTSRLLIALSVTAVFAGLWPVAGSARPQTSGSAGYDISYPQCGSSFPAAPQFGIVGVNGGLANDANGCLSQELAWALASSGTAPKASLYVNTADPGPAPGVTDWPTSGTSAAYGPCSGGWSAACAYIYGEQRAAYSYALAYHAGAATAEGAPWWLDIETTNSWATATSLNVATIQGFIQGLHDPNDVPGAATTYPSGAQGPVGIYSTASQWATITGLGGSTTAASFGGSLPGWVAGARTQSQARSSCTTNFTGAPVTLAQYQSAGFDADLRCS